MDAARTSRPMVRWSNHPSSSSMGPRQGRGLSAVIPYLGDRCVLVYDRGATGLAVGAGGRGHDRSRRGPAGTRRRARGTAGRRGPSFGSNPTMLAVTLDPGHSVAIGLWKPPLPWVDWWPHVRSVQPGRRRLHRRRASIETTYDRSWVTRRGTRSPARQEQRRAEGVAFQVDMASELVAPFRFEEVAAPALVGHGSATAKEHLRGSAWLVEQLPDATLHSVPGAGTSPIAPIPSSSRRLSGPPCAWPAGRRAARVRSRPGPVRKPA